MSQNDFNLANQGFPSMRSDMNSALQALASNSAGDTEPSTTYAYQLWYDSTADALKIRNADNDAWITFATFDQAADTWSFESLNVDGNVSVDGDLTLASRLIIGESAYAATDTDTTNTGSVTLDFDANQNFVLTFTGNVTFANPTTGDIGQTGFIVIIQDATGGRTLSLGTDFETVGGGGITLSADASATDVIPYMFIAANRILLGAPQLAFA